MGCDIHIYTEELDRHGKWRCADFFEINEYYNGDADDEPRFEHVEFYRGRDYELFGALAGVRKEIRHIKPKGFPEDASVECKEAFEYWDGDAHTPSYLTLRELRQHQIDLGDTVKRSGMITKEQAEALIKGVKPDSWCGWTNTPEYLHAEWEDEYNPLELFLNKLDQFLSLKYRSGKLRHMEDNEFRIVFWFDN